MSIETVVVAPSSAAASPGPSSSRLLLLDVVRRLALDLSHLLHLLELVPLPREAAAQRVFDLDVEGAAVLDERRAATVSTNRERRDQPPHARGAPPRRVAVRVHDVAHRLAHRALVRLHKLVVVVELVVVDAGVEHREQGWTGAGADCACCAFIFATAAAWAASASSRALRSAAINFSSSSCTLARPSSDASGAAPAPSCCSSTSRTCSMLLRTLWMAPPGASAGSLVSS